MDILGIFYIDTFAAIIIYAITGFCMLITGLLAICGSWAGILAMIFFIGIFTWETQTFPAIMDKEQIARDIRDNKKPDPPAVGRKSPLIVHVAKGDKCPEDTEDLLYICPKIVEDPPGVPFRNFGLNPN